ncbi:MAG: substrate-binding domain-containing protein [Candidatus Thermoplasmatota archaeon]|jgi:accessory colonization factor AcfC|nr:substrate-binding domain-containing protein [Candidatus Thermoplasmatota archaeon]
MDHSINIFCAKGCSLPTFKVASLFSQISGISANVDVCSGHCNKPHAYKNVKDNEKAHTDMLDEIRSSGHHDLVISGADFLLDDAELNGLVLKGTRKSIAYRRSALIVKKGNPKSITGLDSLTISGIKVGVSIIDCLQGAWEDICGRARLIDPVRSNITLFVPGCFAIINAVADGVIDVGFGWSAFKYLEPKKLDVVELPENLQIFRATSVAMLEYCQDKDLARKFIEFILTPESVKIYLELGWDTPE